MTGQRPYHDKSEPQTYLAISQGITPDFPPSTTLARSSHEGSLSRLSTICRQCWNLNPQSRPSMEDNRKRVSDVLSQSDEHTIFVPPESKQGQLTQSDQHLRNIPNNVLAARPLAPKPQRKEKSRATAKKHVSKKREQPENVKPAGTRLKANSSNLPLMQFPRMPSRPPFGKGKVVVKVEADFRGSCPR